MKQFYANAQKAIRQLLLLVLLSLLSYASTYAQSTVNPTHFTTVWQGENGQNHMNFIVISAILDDIQIGSDDEIAVFSGLSCVGFTKLTQSISTANSSTFGIIKASQDDGSANGFKDNDTIIFKLWDSKNQKEMLAKTVKYRNDMPTWLTNGKFLAGATSVVEIVSYTEYTQSIPLIKGTNLFSAYVIPANPNLSVVMKTLCDQGALIKVLDETGKSFSYVTTSKSWVNNIGSLTKTEGYSISVNFNCTLNLTGRLVTLPLDIPLRYGWNFISFPSMNAVSAMSVVQPLIDQNKLLKVVDEKGYILEKPKGYSAWRNSNMIFYPGKAYKINVSAACTLTIQKSYLKSAINPSLPEITEYFRANYEGNGSDHMNINLIGLNESGYTAGDELAAFDGDVCVGALKLTKDNLTKDFASIITSSTTDLSNQDGFIEGNPIQIYSWNKITGVKSAVQAEIINGEMKFAKNASILIQSKTLSTAAKSINSLISFEVFPNPAKKVVNVRFSKIPEAGSRIEILDISGRKIATRIIQGITEELIIDNQVAGLYLVKSIIGSDVIIQKLIIEK